VSDQVPIGDLGTGQHQWVCVRCGRTNKASWTRCPGCDAGRDGRPSAAIAHPGPAHRPGGLSALLGVLVLAALAGLVVWLAPTVWQWVADVGDALVAWVSSRT
jgi:ferric-dicitrate binding protein FerR (iron transport regulator)